MYGGAAVVALWLTSAIVGAIDSIPLVCIKLQMSIFHTGIQLRNANSYLFDSFLWQFPKVLEVIGLGYTVWFTSRYLLFKVFGYLACLSVVHIFGDHIKVIEQHASISCILLTCIDD